MLKNNQATKEQKTKPLAQEKKCSLFFIFAFLIFAGTYSSHANPIPAIPSQESTQSRFTAVPADENTSPDIPDEHENNDPKALSPADDKTEDSKTALENALAAKKLALKNLTQQRENKKDAIEKLQKRKKNESVKQKKETDKKIDSIQEQIKDINKRITAIKNTEIPDLEKRLVLLKQAELTPAPHVPAVPNSPSTPSQPQNPTPPVSLNQKPPISPEEEIQALKNDLEKNQQDQSEIQKQIEGIDESIKGLDEQIADLNKQISAISAKSAEILNSSDKTVKERILEIQEEIESNKDFINMLKEDSEKEAFGIERMSHEIDQIVEENEKIYDQIDALTFEDLDNNPPKNGEKIFDLELEINSNEVEIDSIDKHIERSQDRIMENDRLIDKIETYNFQLQSELRELESRDPDELLYPESQIEADINNNQLEIENIQMQIMAIENEKSNLNGEKENLLQSLDELKMNEAYIQDQIRMLYPDPAAPPSL
ncbi:MAG TPA: hypothetical protein PLY88_01775 [Candidatus Omnitrophota bacterium]|nr:hypothetical protein [Candidatus Omnitrophota bacterium]